MGGSRLLSRRQCFTMRKGLLATCFLLASSAAADLIFDDNTQIDVWSKIGASRELKWQKCFTKDTFCSKLTVPLVHEDPLDNRTIDVAIVKNSLGNAERTVFFNPGGPGGDATSSIVTQAENLRRQVGYGSDLVAVIPRAVSATLPAISCGDFKSIEQEDVAIKGDLDLGQTNSSIDVAWEHGLKLQQQCADMANETLPYIGTIHVAKDMELVRRAMELPMLNYYGVSYGTAIGMTYAKLFPDKVLSMVLTGVIDIHSWFTPTSDPRGVYSADAEAFNSMYRACHAAGPKYCPVWDENVHNIRLKVERADRKLAQQKIVVTPSFNFTSNDFRWLMLNGLRGGVFAKNLQIASEILEDKPGPALQELARDDTIRRQNSQPTSVRALEDFAGHSNSKDALYAIQCSDSGGLDQRPRSSEIQHRLDKIQKVSNASAAWIMPRAGVELECQAADLPGADRPRPEAFRNVTTKYPILFVGNTADWTTPLWNAQRAHKSFPNSALLTVEGTGHAASADPALLCTQKWLVPYFRAGAVPPEDTVCDSEQQLEILKDFKTTTHDFKMLGLCEEWDGTMCVKPKEGGSLSDSIEDDDQGKHEH